MLPSKSKYINRHIKLLKDEPAECQTCRDGVGILFSHLATEPAGQIELLNDNVCPEAPDVEGCKVGVETWWPIIAGIIFSPEAAAYTCRELSGGACLPVFRY